MAKFETWFVWIAFGVLGTVSVTVFAFEEIRRDICDNDAFSEQCTTGHVLVITSAEYGHIGLSECVEIDTGHFGCKVGVSDDVSGRCSGMGACRLPTPVDMFSDLRPCRRGLGMFLRISYICVPGILATPCEQIVLQGNEYFISSLSTPSDSCSTMVSIPGTQYHLQAKQGQQIQVSTQLLHPARLTHGDVTVGYVMDEDPDQERSVQSLGVTSAEGQVVLTQTNEVTLVLEETTSDVEFLVKFKAVGCEDLDVPHGMWVQRQGSQVTTGCVNSQKSWLLHCSGVYWSGVIGNCSQEVTPPSVVLQQEVSQISMSIPKEIIIMIIIAVTVVLALVVMTTGYVCYKKASLSTPSCDPQFEVTYSALPDHPQYNHPHNIHSSYPYQNVVQLHPDSNIVRFAPPVPPTRQESTYSRSETLPIREEMA